MESGIEGREGVNEVIVKPRKYKYVKYV